MCVEFIKIETSLNRDSNLKYLDLKLLEHFIAFPTKPVTVQHKAAHLILDGD